MVARTAKPRSAKLSPEVITAPPPPLPNVLMLTKQSATMLWLHKKLFVGILVLYGLLNVLLASSISNGLDVAALRNQYADKFVGSIATFAQLIGNSSSSSGQAAGAYQLVLFVIISLALIWTLRQVHAGESVRIRDAFYRSMYPFIPFVLIILLIGVELLPLIIGTTVYQIVVANGIAASGLEVTVWGLGALGLALLSLYLLVPTVLALFIVTLPNMTPVPALRLAGKLARARRWTVLRKMLFLPLLLLVCISVVLLPVILVAPIAAQYVLLLLGCVSIAVAYSYVYLLYRGLMND
jgi:hypothetical protein